MDIKQEVLGIEQYIIEMRRYFHENPEESWKEFNTQKKICEELEKMDIEYIKSCKTGVIGFLGNRGKRPIVGVRADIDALPVCEATNLAFASKNKNVMHACGHDGHIAMLLGTAKLLKKFENLLKGEVRLFFQPAEEFIADSGAKYMSECDEFKELDNVVGAHIWSYLPTGKISVEAGPRLASADTYDIIIKGKGGHGAMPNQCVDPIICGSTLVNALQSIVSRELSPTEPVVLSVCSFNSGNSFNIIPNEAKLSGTVRTFNNNIRDSIPEKMKRIVADITHSYRAEYEFEFHYGTPATINDEYSSQIATKAVENLYGKESLIKYPAAMLGEDFAKMLAKVPGCFALVGCRNEEKGIIEPHHNPKFDIDEAGLKYGVGFFLQYIFEYMKDYQN